LQLQADHRGDAKVVGSLSALPSFEACTPFDHWDIWREARAQPLAEQEWLLRDLHARG